MCCWEQVEGNIGCSQVLQKKLTATSLDIMAGRGRRNAQSRRYEQNCMLKNFVKGLKPSVRTRLLELYSRTLEEVLGMATKQENKVESYQGENEAQKEEAPKPFQRQDRKMKKHMEGQQSTVASGSEKPECIHCGKRHGGNGCWRMEGSAFMHEILGLSVFRLHSAAGGQDLDAKTLLAARPGHQPPVGGHPLDANLILAARP
ncbi:hypothetical protein Taro_000928 [Colocasia esculenta]|uniref:Uncharacterized protein n=1 Tax=Colocasia esculenta TaxID=4460 RepID=A0A843TJ78_COLES|nr:hypothetical protein [Colocasia esculenta]